MRVESIEMFKKAGDAGASRVLEEEAELAIVDSFLPKQADEATTRAWIQEAIAGGATDAGRIMGALSKAHKGDLNGKLAQALLKEMMA